MKVKALVSMLALAVAAGAANAEITTTGASTPAEAFLIVYNANASFSLDLGLDQIALDSKQNVSFNVSNDSNWAAFLTKAGTASPLLWSVQSLDSDNNIGWTTARVGQEALAGTSKNGARLNGNLDAQFSDLSSYIQNINTESTHFSAANGSSVDLPGTQGYWNFDGANSATGFSKTSNLVGATASLFKFQDNINDPFNAAAKYDWNVGLNTATLATVGGVTTLSLNSPITPSVPEPESYVLALLGLVGVAAATRRRAA